MVFQLLLKDGEWHFLSCLRSGCHNKVPWPEWLTEDMHLLLTVVEAVSPRSQGPSTVKFCEGPTSGSQTAVFSLDPRVAEGEQTSSLASSYEGTNPMHEDLTFLT